MISSRDRILTTHVGSLPRNETLSDLLVEREAGESYDPQQLDAEMDRAVRHVVARQKEAGIDSGNDGEQQRVGFQTYVPQRMSGFGGKSQTPPRPRVRGISRTGGLSGAAFPQCQPPAERARGAGRTALSRHFGDRKGDRALQTH